MSLETGLIWLIFRSSSMPCLEIHKMNLNWDIIRSPWPTDQSSFRTYEFLVLRFQIIINWYDAIPMFSIVKIFFWVHFIDKWQSDEKSAFNVSNHTVWSKWYGHIWEMHIETMPDKPANSSDRNRDQETDELMKCLFITGWTKVINDLP